MAHHDGDRFRDLYREHYAAVFGYCLRRVERDLANDLTSETFAVAWRRRDSVPDDKLALPWLYAIASKAIANHRRAGRRKGSLHRKLRWLAHQPDIGPEAQVIRRVEDAAIVEAVGNLRPADREVILLSAWEGLSAPQIARSVGISVSAAEKRLTRAKHRFRAELERTEKRIGLTPRVAEEGGMR